MIWIVERIQKLLMHLMMKEIDKYLKKSCFSELKVKKFGANLFTIDSIYLSYFRDHLHPLLCTTISLHQSESNNLINITLN